MFSGHEDAPDDINVSSSDSNIVEDFSTLCLSETFSDVTFLVSGEKLHAHKTILAIRNKGFWTLFNENSDKREITILNTSPEAYRLLLKYFYTGTITIPPDIGLIIQVLTLAREYSAKPLTSTLIEQIKLTLDAKKVCIFLNRANDNDFVELRDVCLSFIDDNVTQILSSDSISDLTQKSLFQILKRDTFVAPEKDIFECIAKWCENNRGVDHFISECLRLSLLNVSEIVSIVWPKLVNSENSLETIARIVGTSSKSSLPKLPCMDENIATVQHGAEIISKMDPTDVLNGNTDVEKNIQHTIDGETSIVIGLREPYYVNHIRMRLYDADDRYYSYYIETSLDQIQWHRLVDYSIYPCRSIQNLYFDQRTLRYIKIVGTSSSMGSDFRLVFFEAFNKSNIPKTLNSIVCPEANLVTLENEIIVDGEIKKEELLSGRKFYGFSVGAPGLILQLAQPYVISSMSFLLHQKWTYKYFIETSIDKTNWETVVDRRNEGQTSWQDLHFSERVVVFIKITGTLGPKNWFHCKHFQCPSERKKSNDDDTTSKNST